MLRHKSFPLETAPMIENNVSKFNKENSMANPPSISIKCVSPPSSSIDNDSGDEHEGMNNGEGLRVSQSKHFVLQFYF